MALWHLVCVILVSMFIDTHVHLDFEPLLGDQLGVIQRAQDANVHKMINIGSSLAGSYNSKELADRLDSVFATCGIHPHNAKEVNKNTLRELADLTRHNKVIAIGEIGLDYFKMKNPKKTQLDAFMKQLDLAKELGLPVVIHNRDADHEIYDILRQKEIEIGVVHFFSASYDLAQMFLKMGLYLSFTGVITFSRRSGPTPDEVERDRIIADMPLDRVLIETDSPFAAPEPHRGKPNEPAYVVEVAKRIAEIRKLSLDEVGRITSDNCTALFSI